MVDREHQPDDAYFDRMALHARTHWWYQGRRRLVADVLTGRLPPHAMVIDVGCGTGDNLTTFDELARSGSVCGVELSAHAIRHVPAGPAGTRAAIALAEHLPYATGAADLLASMDVIEHLDDDHAGLAEYRRVVRPGGLLLLTVPAYQWLWSAHDEMAAHRRRYTRRGLVAVADAAGFEVERCTYYNSFLVPPAAVLRRTPLRRLAGEIDDEVGGSSAAVSRVMRGLGAIERRIIGQLSMPFGLSILLIARRRGDP